MADARADELWREVVSNWDDDIAHRAFVEYCRATGQLADAAARYRQAADSGDQPYRDAGRAEVAKKRLIAIATLAIAELDATRTDISEARKRIPRTFRFAVIMIAFVGLLCFWLFVLRGLPR